MSSMRELGGWLLLCALVAACSEPRYAEECEGRFECEELEEQADGGATARIPRDSGQSPPDGDADVASELEDAGGAGQTGEVVEDAAVAESWAAGLVGTYAVRTRHASKSGLQLLPAPMVHEVFTIAHVTLEGVEREPRLRQVMCRDTGDLQAIGFGTFRTSLVFPERYPDRVFRLRRSGAGWEGRNEVTAIGYAPAPPPECTPGGKLPRRPEQVWIKGDSCDCPLTNDPPTLDTDCRVTDPDGDQKPGISVSYTGSYNGVDAIRTEDFDSFANGTIAPDGRHTASMVMNEDSYQFVCSAGACQRGPRVACPAELNPVVFVPLRPKADGTPWTCAEILDPKAELFSADKAIFPPGC